MAYVYRHIRLDKNEPFYIGIGSDSEYKRANTKYFRNNLWNKIVLKTKYEVEILIDDVSWDDACIKEIEFIKLYGRIDLENGTLANLTDGGEGTLNVISSAETRLKKSECRKGEKHHLFGKHLSEETKQKLRVKAINRRHTDEVKKRMSESKKGKKSIWKNPEERKRRISEKAKGRLVPLELRKKHIEISPRAQRICRYVDGKLITYLSKNQASLDLFGRKKHIPDDMIGEYGLFYPIL
jgi:hypothetical protein